MVSTTLVCVGFLRNISIKNVTQERAKWRKQIREKSSHVTRAIISRDRNKLNQLRYEFTTLLNPNDDDDNNILNIVSLREQDYQEANAEANAEEFSIRIAFLLKHDWERAKLETHWYGFLCNSPQRTKFQFSEDIESRGEQRVNNCQCLTLVILLCVLIIITSVVEIISLTSK